MIVWIIKMSISLIYLIVILMRKILFTTSLVLLLLHALCDQRYTPTKEFPNDSDARKIAFTDDDQIVILYNTNDTQLSFFRSFDLKPLHSSVTTASITYLQCFTTKDQQYSLILGSQKGVISLKKFTQKQSQDQVQLTTIADCNVKKVIVGPNQQNYAVFCENGNSVLIGDMSAPETQIKTIDAGFTVQAMSWHPAVNKLAVAGTTQDLKFKLIIVDTVSGDSLDYSANVTKKTMDVQFSADGQQLAYITQLSSFVSIINLNDNTTSYLAASESTQLLQIERSGTLLSAFDTQNTYIWVFNAENYGKYISTMKSTGLSKFGGFLFTFDPTSQHIILNQICPNAVFLNDQKKCAACQPPCKSCFVNQKECSSCVDNYYLNQATFLCQICVQNCKTCIDAQDCKQCLDGFYLDSNKCGSCPAKFQGCLLCNSTNCSKCDGDNNWQLYNAVCTCKAKFVQMDGKCLHCPLHCLSCSDTTTCVYCDIFQFRKLAPVDGKCICDTKYFENIAGDCAPCTRGCLTCDNKDTCKVCDANDHWVLQPKQNICECASGYFLSKDVCDSCSTINKGCIGCSSQKICTSCDSSKHWVLDQKNHKCACQSGYIASSNQCATCPSLIEGCASCLNKDTCSNCGDGYTLNSDTKKCDKVSSGGISVVVVIVVGIAVLIGLVVGSYFIVKMIRKRKGKKVETLLETQGGQEQIEEMK